MTEQSPAIHIRELTKTFRIGLRRKRTKALRGLDLDVQAGEIFGFLGPNGAGKTTTIKILVGLLNADRGQARIFGKSVKDAASTFKAIGFILTEATYACYSYQADSAGSSPTASGETFTCTAWTLAEIHTARCPISLVIDFKFSSHPAQMKTPKEQKPNHTKRPRNQADGFAQFYSP